MLNLALTGYAGLIIFFLSAFLGTALTNLIFFRRLQIGRKRNSDTPPYVSICIPARNEESSLASTLKSIAQQTDIDFECLILDDQSTDRTSEIIQAYVERDSRFEYLSGAPLPNGWLGKVWACHQLGRAAKGELLLFTDADVQWEKGALSQLIQYQQMSKADLLTVWPTQALGSWAEWFVVPLMKFTIMSYLPVMMTHYSPFTAFAAANGQCLLFTKEAYRQIGGHQAVKSDIIEDVGMARLIKQNRLALRMVDGGEQIRCRMYSDWQSVKRGFGKNILAGHGDSLIFLAVSTLWHWSAFVLPWIAVIFAPSYIHFIWLGLAVSLRFLADLWINRRPAIAIIRALLMPVSVFLMTQIAWQAIRWHFGGGPVWKGRAINSHG